MGYIDPYYSSGKFIAKSSGFRDAPYKIGWIKEFLYPHIKETQHIYRAADIGCGTGHTTRLLKEMFGNPPYPEVEVHGFDIHPETDKLPVEDGVTFYRGDFLEIAKQPYDMVFLLDVIEHLVKPSNFLNQLSSLCRWLVAIIPLDDSIFTWIRDVQRNNLVHPGHLSIFNSASAINLVTESGFRIVDFTFVPVFAAPSGRDTTAQKLLNPLRTILYRVSPYLLQKLIGGTSLLLLARTPLSEQQIVVNLDDYPYRNSVVYSRDIQYVKTQNSKAELAIPKYGKLNYLNDVGSKIWLYIDGKHTVGQIAAIIAEEYAVSIENAQQDTIDFVAELMEKGICRLRDDVETSSS